MKVKIRKARERFKESWKRIEKKKWFKIFKKNFLNLKLEDRIELGKFCYEKDFKLSTWLIGIGIAVFVSVNLSGIVSLKQGFFYISGIVAYITAPILLLVGIILLGISTNRQKIKMAYLYKLNKTKKKLK